MHYWVKQIAVQLDLQQHRDPEHFRGIIKSALHTLDQNNQVDFFVYYVYWHCLAMAYGSCDSKKF